MREIREEKQFKKDLKDLGISPAKLDLLLEGIVLTVSTHPEIFPDVDGKPNLRRLHVPAFPGLRCMNIWFTYSEKTVQFLEIDVIDDL